MNKTNKKIINFLVITFLIVLMCPVSVFAAGATTGLTNLTNFFSDIIRIIGVLFAIYSFSILGPGISQHDSSQVKMGLLLIAGAAIMIFHMQILNLMGITI